MNDDSLFASPPRPRGRGWWRRFRGIAAYLFLAACATGILGGIALSLLNERRESIQTVERGIRSTCRIVDKRAYRNGRSTDYYVTIQIERGTRREVQVDSSAYTQAVAGRTIAYYFDPSTGVGIAEIERDYREGLLGATFAAGIGLLVLVALALKIRARVREMRLLRTGVELTTTGGGREIRILHEGFSMRAPTPNSDALIRTGPGGQEFVVLASRDLARFFFPELRDVPVERLVREELVVPRLPVPVRAPSPEWAEWLARKYRAQRLSMVFLGPAGCALIALVNALDGFGAACGIVFGVVALLELVLLLSWMRGFWRDRVLWREGDEIHAVILEERSEQGRRAYTLAFAYRGQEHRGTARMPEAFGALLARSPEGAPAVTARAVILVDPYRPGRWTPVPATCATDSRF